MSHGTSGISQGLDESAMADSSQTTAATIAPEPSLVGLRRAVDQRDPSCPKQWLRLATWAARFPNRKDMHCRVETHPWGGSLGEFRELPT